MLAATTETPNSPSLIVAQNTANECRPDLPALVGHALRRAAPFTADELERHVASCGYLMLSAYQRYEESHCLGDLGEAHRWKRLMEEGIKSRSAAMVAKLEQERGLA